MKKSIILITTISISILLLKVGIRGLEEIKKKQTEERRIETWNNRIAMVNDNWGKISINENLVLPKPNINDWSYPWYTIKHQDGHFENTMSDEIKAEDTIKITHQSHCYSFINGDTISRLKFSKAKKIRGNVFIELYDESASNNETLELEIVNFEKFNPTYKINYVFPYDSIAIHFLRKELEIKKDIYQKGEILIGKINLELEQKIYRTENNSQKIDQTTKRLKGVFEVKIK